MKRYLPMFLLALTACGNMEPQSGQATDTPVVPPSGPPTLNLPQPALNSAEVTLGGVRHTLTHNFSCRPAGIALYAGAGVNPGIIAVRPDFTANGEVNLETNTGWVFMMDETVNGVSVNWGTLGCRAWAIGDQPGYFELQAADCQLQNTPTNPTLFTTVSFKVRCSK